MKPLRLSDAALLCTLSTSALAQGPEVTAWRQNLYDAKGASTNATIHAAVSTLPADVQQVAYDNSFVYVLASGIPSHYCGPFPGNPGVPADQALVHKITLTPTPATTPQATRLGSIGVMLNGVPFFNQEDGRSYFNQNTWFQNALHFELGGLDAALGHPAPRGVYHYHCYPSEYLLQAGETYGSEHSPLIGFAYDGYPVYGPYGYSNTTGGGGIRRMEPGWQPRNITVRQTLPDGTPLPANLYGPVVSAQFPIGAFIEDFEFVTNSGDLDEHNGRFAVTPEYPNGTYAYYATVDANGDPAFPYLIGPTYYGAVVNQQGAAIPANATTYRSQVVSTGAGCGTIDLSANGSPTVPNPGFGLSTSRGPASGVAFYGFSVVSLLPEAADVLGCGTYLDVNSPIIATSAALDSQGSHTLPVPIPNSTGLVGVAFHAVALGFGAAFEVSNSLTFLIQ
ncbi:MAG: YHYH protein [bacterium]|nr:YHYH protein [bacterium]